MMPLLISCRRFGFLSLLCIAGGFHVMRCHIFKESPSSATIKALAPICLTYIYFFYLYKNLNAALWEKCVIRAAIQ